MNSIIILYTILLGFLVLCTASVYLVSAVDRNQDYDSFKKFLLSAIFSYLVSFVFGQEKIAAALIFSFQIFPMLFMVDYFFEGGLKPKFKTFLKIHAFGVLTSIVLIFFVDNFTIYALPLTLTAYSPGLYFLNVYRKKELTYSNSFYLSVIFLGFLNFLSFAFFRFVPQAELWGWSAAVLNYILAMYCFFLIILDKKVYLDAELKSELQLTNTLYKTLIHDTSNDLNYLSFSLSRAIKRDDISIVEKANDRLNELIRFKTEIRKQYQNDGLVIYDINLIDVLNRIEENYIQAYSDKNIKLEKSICSLSSKVSIFLSEEVLVKTVIGNLLSNALKFSPENSVVRLSIKIEDECLFLSVTDAGKGMPEYLITQVKEYSKVTSSKGTKMELGTGMGLGIVCFVVDRVKGTIDFLNQKNGGLKVDIRIPLFMEDSDIKTYQQIEKSAESSTLFS